LGKNYNRQFIRKNSKAQSFPAEAEKRRGKETTVNNLNQKRTKNHGKINIGRELRWGKKLYRNPDRVDETKAL